MRAAKSALKLALLVIFVRAFTPLSGALKADALNPPTASSPTGRTEKYELRLWVIRPAPKKTPSFDEVSRNSQKWFAFAWPDGIPWSATDQQILQTVRQKNPLYNVQGFVTKSTAILEPEREWQYGFRRCIQISLTIHRPAASPRSVNPSRKRSPLDPIAGLIPCSLNAAVGRLEPGAGGDLMNADTPSKEDMGSLRGEGQFPDGKIGFLFGGFDYRMRTVQKSPEAPRVKVMIHQPHDIILWSFRKLLNEKGNTK